VRVLRPFFLWGWLLLAPVLAQHATNAPDFGAATTEALKLKLGPGLRMDVWAAEPQLSNSVAFAFDGRGRALLAQSDRWAISVFDITAHTNWLLEDMSFRNVADRAAFLRREFATNLTLLTKDSEVVRRVEDRDGDGRADHHANLYTGFNSVTDGTAAGVLAAAGQIYFANIPDVWRFPDTPDDPGQPLQPRPENLIAQGFGVHIGVSGHDLHGLLRGPDGRIYFSFGDRGLCLTNREGVVINLPDTGGVLRCEPDGRRLELFCFGLRNPQELAFDDEGNLWTVDNDTAGADPCRVLHLVEGGDYGWRTSYQHMEGFGPWVKEALWKGGTDGILPPAGTVSQGPSGLAFYPGTGFGAQLKGRFLHCDFPGGVWSFSVKPRGASFELDAKDKFLWGCWPTDVDFGPDGAAYVLDWVSGWGQTPRGRIYRITPSVALGATEMESVRQVKDLLASGLAGQKQAAVLGLLAHADRRLRLAAQWELAQRGESALEGLGTVALDGRDRLARLHAVWGLGQILRARSVPRFSSKDERAVARLLVLLEDSDRRLAAESAAALAEAGISEGWPALSRLLADPDALVRRRTGEAIARMPLGVGPNPVAGMGGRQSRILKDRLGLGWVARLGGLGGFAQTQARDPLVLVRTLLESGGDDPFLHHTARRILLQATPFAAGQGTWHGVNRLAETERFPSEQLARVEGSFLQQALRDASPAVRLAALRTCRRLAELAFIHPQVAGLPGFHEALLSTGTLLTHGLGDADPGLVEEAGRAIHDVPIAAGIPGLASFVTKIDCPAGLQSRVIDACSRLGTQQHAQMLASFAAREDVPDELRVLAVRTLAEWSTPPALDRVNGLWRPMVVQTRDATSSGSASTGTGAAANPLLDRASQAALASRNFGRAAAVPELTEDLGRTVAFSEGHAVKRNPAPARRAFLRVAGDLLNPLNLSESGVPVGTREVLSLQIATVEAAAALGVKEASSPLYERFTRTNSAPALRRAILVALVSLNAAQAPDAIEAALGSSDAPLRVAVVPYLDRLGGVEAVSILARLIPGSGTPKGDDLALAQAAVAALGRLPETSASEALNAPWVALEAGTLPSELVLDVESAAEARSALDSVWAERLKRRRSAVSAGPDRWRFALAGGIAERGERVFRENPTVQCLRCHKIGADGGIVGPELTKVGARLSREELLASIVDPNSRMAAGFESVVVTLRTGETLAGTVKAESDDVLEVELTDADTGALKRLTLKRSEVVRRDRGPSAMPEGLADQLGRFELRDLVEYLAGLR